MSCIKDLLLFRLNRSVLRLNEFYKLNAPAVVIEVELMIIKDICNKLSMNDER